MDTIALFGGSFDPPHLGHVAIVEALEKLDFIDKIIIVPAFLNPFKTKTFASSEQRLAWLECLFETKKKVCIENYELVQKRKVTSIETVEYLLQKYAKIYFVIGADNLANLHQWHRFEALDEKVTFIVAKRNKIAIPKQYMTLDVDSPISSTMLRKKLDTKKISKKCAEQIAHHYKENNAK